MCPYWMWSCWEHSSNHSFAIRIITWRWHFFTGERCKKTLTKLYLCDYSRGPFSCVRAVFVISRNICEQLVWKSNEGKKRKKRKKKEEACLTIGNEFLACEQYSAEKNDIRFGISCLKISHIYLKNAIHRFWSFRSDCNFICICWLAAKWYISCVNQKGNL